MKIKSFLIIIIISNLFLLTSQVQAQEEDKGIELYENDLFTLTVPTVVTVNVSFPLALGDTMTIIVSDIEREHDGWGITLNVNGWANDHSSFSYFLSEDPHDDTTRHRFTKTFLDLSKPLLYIPLPVLTYLKSLDYEARTPTFKELDGGVVVSGLSWYPVHQNYVHYVWNNGYLTQIRYLQDDPRIHAEISITRETSVWLSPDDGRTFKTFLLILAILIIIMVISVISILRLKSYKKKKMELKIKEEKALESKWN